MLSSLAALLSVAAVANSAALMPRTPAGGAQSIPNTAPSKFFRQGVKQLTSEPPEDHTTPVPDVYGARNIDLPFYRLYHGNMKFFSAGQLNTPDKDTDVWIENGGVDAANQSACGIPDNAFSGSKVAIHPYFLKYADLSRFCEQDVCISFWKEDGSSDMILKVTDICSTDENDPTHCATPSDIKLDRGKAGVMEHLPSAPTGDEYPEQVWWFFTKCWADALAQPAYDNNWFTTPALPNNLNWSQTTAYEQYHNNQAAYAAKGWPLYPNGGYNTTRVDNPVTDWVKGQEPCYQPIAGGKGWGNKICGQGQSSSSPGDSAAPAVSSASIAPSSASSMPATQPSQPAISQQPAAVQPATGQPAGQDNTSPATNPPAANPPPASNPAPVAPPPPPPPANMAFASKPLQNNVQDEVDDQDECEL